MIKAKDIKRRDVCQMLENTLAPNSDIPGAHYVEETSRIVINNTVTYELEDNATGKSYAIRIELEEIE